MPRIGLRSRFALPRDHRRRLGSMRTPCWPSRCLPAECHPTPQQSSCLSPLGSGNGFDKPLSIKWDYPHGSLTYQPKSFPYYSPGLRSSRTYYPDIENCGWRPPAGRMPQRVHPDLMHNHLDWDMLQNPMTAQCHTFDSCNSVRPQYDENATIPGVREIVLRIGIPSIAATWAVPWGPIRVGGDGRGNITIREVLKAIYNYFHTPLTDWETAVIGSSINSSVVYEGYLRRLNTSGSLYRSFSNGWYPLRIDTLNGYTYFDGIRVNDAVGAREGRVEMILDLRNWLTPLNVNFVPNLYLNKLLACSPSNTLLRNFIFTTTVRYNTNSMARHEIPIANFSVTLVTLAMFI